MPGRRGAACGAGAAAALYLKSQHRVRESAAMVRVSVGCAGAGATHNLRNAPQSGPRPPRHEALPPAASAGPHFEPARRNSSARSASALASALTFSRRSICGGEARGGGGAQGIRYNNGWDCRWPGGAELSQQGAKGASRGQIGGASCVAASPVRRRGGGRR